jgi:phage-related protein
MKKIRDVIIYKNYFEEFFVKQTQKTKDKIIKILDIVENLEIIPANYLKPINGVSGLYEIRVQLASNIFRIFCLFESDRVVVLLSGFQKKDQKIPQSEIEKAKRIMNEYYNEKKGNDL